MESFRMECKTMKNRDFTKTLLVSSLKELMRIKPVEKISIRELTEKCGVNRQTFYYHFEDIYDLLRWMFQQEAIQLLQLREDALQWQGGLLQLFHYLEDNRDICICALHSLGRDHLKRFFYTEIHNTIEIAVIEAGKQSHAKEDYMNFLTHFYTLSLAALAESWLQDEIDQTPEELIAMIEHTLTDQHNGALLRIQSK